MTNDLTDGLTADDAACSDLTADDLTAAAASMRLDVLRLAAKVGLEGKGAHIASSLSMVEIAAVLFLKVMRPQDVFVLSKGHGGLAYYTALKASGRITGVQLETYLSDGGDFPGQPRKSDEYGIAFSSGSLGMGLAYACGLALAAGRRGEDKRIYVLIGDGELNEGSNWEAVMFAKQQKLGNLIVLIDQNGMQLDGSSSDILDVDIQGAFGSFGWQTRICDGHCVRELVSAFDFSDAGDYDCDCEMPKAVFATTTKGKGVSFMENNNAWHHARLNHEQYQNALKELCVDGV